MKRRRVILLAAALVVAAALLAWLTSSSGTGVQAELVAEAPRAEAPPEQRVRVEVLNAAGIPRLAQRGTELLRDQGFDVVFYGNASGFPPDSSVVVDRVGDLAAAMAVAEAIGIERVRLDPDSTLYLEVTVVLGEDWESQAPAETLRR